MIKIFHVISSSFSVISSVVERSRFLHFGRNDIFFLFGLLILWFFGFSSPAHAQSVSLSVDPPVTEILIAPTKKATQTFTLRTSGEDLLVTPELRLVKALGSSGHVEIAQTPLDITKIPLNITSSLPLNKPHPVRGGVLSITLTFEGISLDTAQDAYLALVFQTNPAGPAGQRDDSRVTSTNPGISALILVTVTPSPVLPIDLEITDFSPPLVHDSWLPLTITPSIKNNVDVMVRPVGLYEIISPSGKTIHSSPLYQSLVLGNSSRLLTSNISNLASTLIWSPKWSNIGPYSLRLTISTQGGTKITQVEKTVWVLPLRLMTLIFLICVLLLIIVIRRSSSIDKTLK